MSRARCLVWVGLAAALHAAAEDAAPAARPDPANGVYTLRLDQGVLKGVGTRAEHAVPLTVQAFSRDGRFVHAWATTDENNSAVWEADAAALEVAGRQLKGAVKVIHEYVQYAFSVKAETQGAAVAGDFECVFGATETAEASGSVAGRLQPLASSADSINLELSLGPAMYGPNEKQRLAALSLSIRQGQIGEVKLYPAGSGSWTATVKKCELKCEDNELTGALVAEATTGPAGKAMEYLFEFDGAVAGAGAVGSYTRQIQGEDPEQLDFRGKVMIPEPPKISAEKAAYALQMEAAAARRPLEVNLDCSKGQFRTGIAIAPQFLPKLHRVDGSSFRLDGNKIKGELDVAINPYGWGVTIWNWGYGIPRPVAYRYALEAEITGTELSGKYSGQAVTRNLSGTLAGSMQSWEEWRSKHAFAKGTDYPCWRGQYGNGSAADAGHKLVETLHEARLAWRSSEKILDAWLWSKSINPGVSGGFSSPILADGKVYVFYFQPGGKFFAPKREDPNKKKTYEPGLIDADDVMLCLDAQTGIKLWRAVFKDKGLNFNGGAGPHMTPCAAGGSVYGIGSAGRIYCLDAASGELRWESSVGPEADRMETMREQCHKDLVLATLSLDFCSAPVVANGVLVCNDNREGLIGLDAESGKQLWGPVPNCIRKTSAPLVWRHEDKNYIVSAFNRAVCLEPKTGKLIWEIGEDVANQGTPAICENYMVTGVGVKGSGVTCFKISPSGAQKHWSLPPQYACHVTSPVIYKGHVYCFAGGGMAICVDLESGKIVGAASFYSVRSCSSFVAAEGRIVRPHLYNKLLLYDADPEKFRQLGAIWTAPSYGENTTPAIADGRLVFRGKDCVYCYDLRRRAEDGR